MSSLTHQLCGLLRCSPLPSTRLSISNWKRFSPNQTRKSKALPVVSAAASPTPISNSQTKDRLQLKQLFKEAYERCFSTPLDGVSFSLDDFHAALANYDFVSELGTKVNSTFHFFLCVCVCEFIVSVVACVYGFGCLFLFGCLWKFAVGFPELSVVNTHELLFKIPLLTQMEVIALRKYLILFDYSRLRNNGITCFICSFEGAACMWEVRVNEHSFVE